MALLLLAQAKRAAKEAVREKLPLIPSNAVQTSPTSYNAFRRALAWRNGSTYSARLRLCA